MTFGNAEGNYSQIMGTFWVTGNFLDLVKNY